MNGELGVGQVFFGFVDPVFRQVLVQSHTRVFLKNFAEIVFGEAYLGADLVDGQLFFVMLINVFKSRVYHRLLDGGEEAGFVDIPCHLDQFMDDLVEQIAGLYLDINIFLIVHQAEIGEIAPDIVQGQDRNDALGVPDHVVVEFGMASAENHVKIFPAGGSF